MKKTIEDLIALSRQCQIRGDNDLLHYAGRRATGYYAVSNLISEAAVTLKKVEEMSDGL